MGILDRIATLVKSHLNDLISRAEEPEKMLDQIITDMNRQLSRAKEQVAAAIADEKRLKDQVEAAYRGAQDWERKAMFAVQQLRDDLAKLALLRRHEHLEQAQELESAWRAHVQETEGLKDSLRDLNDKIQEARRKRNLLLARQRRARAHRRIAESMSSMSERSAFEAFARMEEKIGDNERRLQASAEIEETFTGDRLAGDFRRLEQAVGAADADEQLLALKQRMGLVGAGAAASTRQIASGDADSAPAPVAALASPEAA